MSDAFQIIESNKAGLESNESYVITRGATSFLRVLGSEPQWTLMTATASEDHDRIRVCADRRRLVASAFRLGVEIETDPVGKKDRAGREFVRICVINREPGQSQEDFESENAALFRRFFEIFDEYEDPDSGSGDEMRELYGAVATDDQDGDVYLSDGVWLSSDGSLHDRGR